MSARKKKRKQAAPGSSSYALTWPRRRLIGPLGLIIVLMAAAQYIQTLTYDFVLDDYSAIVENTITQGGIQSLPTIFKTPYRYGYAIQGDELYRPVPKAVFALLWQWFPNNPMPGHLLNIFLYALTGWLLFITLIKFLPQKIPFAFIASLLFITHPIHTEVVANIKSMDEILSFLFFLLSLQLLHTYLSHPKTKWLMGAAACYFASLLSKESAITYVAIFPLFIFYFLPKAKGKANAMLAFFAVAACYLIIRYRVVGLAAPVSMTNNALLASDDWLVQKASAVYILGRYLLLLFLPASLTFDYSYHQLPLVSVGDWRFLLAAVVYSSLLIFACCRVKKRSMLAFGILFYLTTLSISSNLFITIGTNMAERLLYVPSLGFCLCVAALADYWLIKKAAKLPDSLNTFFTSHRVVLAATAVVVMLFTIKVWRQNPVWKSNLTLYESGVTRSPASHRTHYYLGNLLLKKSYYSRFDEPEQRQVIARGLNELRQSISIYPDFGDAYLHIGNYYTNVQRPDSAIYYYLKTLSKEPWLATAHNNLGTVYFSQKRWDEAIHEFNEAIRNDPNYHDAYRNLGSAYGTVGKYAESIEAFRHALLLAPNSAETCYYLGITYRSMGDEAQAKIYLNRAAALDPQFRQ